MTQYWTIKEQYPDDIVFFRLGDFYEMFDQDAVEASHILDVVLTQRKNKTDGNIAMCGVPYHSADNYIAKLVKSGKSVVICEQVEEAHQSTHLVDRQVVKIITPGTIMLENALDGQTSQYIASLARFKDTYALALADISTGEFRTSCMTKQHIIDALSTLHITELLLSSKQQERLLQELPLSRLSLTTSSSWSFQPDRAWQELCTHFQIDTLEGMGFSHPDPSIGVAGALLTYLKYTQHADLKHITTLRPPHDQEHVIIDANTIQNLELIHPLRSSPQATSLFETLNHTGNPMGARLLKQWIIFPLKHPQDIAQRQDTIQWFLDHPDSHRQWQEHVRSMSDILRLLGRIATNQGGPRDLGNLNHTLSLIPQIISHIPPRWQDRLSQLYTQLKPLHHELSQALQDTLPVLAREGGFIRHGYRSDVDELLDLTHNGDQWIKQLQEQERQNTGIPSLKVNVNKVFGYYIEVTKAHSTRVPEHYIKKQTLTNAERYITPELKEFEEKIFLAHDNLIAKEQEIFDQLISYTLEFIQSLHEMSDILAQCDALQSLAFQAWTFSYCRPHLVEEPCLEITAGRHPVLESLSPATFIANDTHMTDHQFLLLTGPNMGGKSTYIRQVALITLLAHMGSFVPATQAQIGNVDRIFTRVGASDNLSQGQSTFMVEMIEVAHILNTATSQSLIILDEVGRGTATYDGMSLAQAISEDIYQRLQARTLFATHYHELVSLADSFPHMTNIHVSVEEHPDHITFLHRIKPGSVDKSYGLAIAKRAGCPQSVLTRAQDILSGLEAQKGQQSIFSVTPQETSHPSKRSHNTTALEQELNNLSLDDMTPRQALEYLTYLQDTYTS